MFSAYLTLLTSLSIAGVAAWYSIVGLTAIFSGAVIPVVIMGSVLEVGKLVTASWLYKNWKLSNFLLKTYLTIAVVVLMFITSMGIFGFLSKAHIEQTMQNSGGNSLQIELLENRIQNERRIIEDSERVVAQLDEAVNILQEYDRIRGPDGAIAVRQSQAEERQQLSNTIENAVDNIQELTEELLPLRQEQITLEAEVGPLRYIAELIYGEEAQNYFDEAVRMVIIIIVSVFDPLAVMLLIAANSSIKTLRDEKKKVYKNGDKFIIDKNNIAAFDKEPEVEEEPEEEIEEPVANVEVKENVPVKTVKRIPYGATDFTPK